MDNNQLLETVKPVFNYLVELRCRFDKGDNIPIKTLQNEVINKLDNVKEQIENLPGMHERKEHAMYALIALTDDVILFSQWRERSRWEPMEKRYYTKTLAGDEFFNRVDNNEIQNDPDLAEIYYISLALGFSRDEIKIRSYMELLYPRIKNRLHSNDGLLSPEAGIPYEVKESKLPPMFGFLSICIIVISFVILYFIGSKWLFNDASEFIHETSNLLSNGI